MWSRVLLVQLLLQADDLHHAQIDGEEAPNLPEKKCAHEERDARGLRGVDIGIDSVGIVLAHVNSPWRLWVATRGSCASLL